MSEDQVDLEKLLSGEPSAEEKPQPPAEEKPPADEKPKAEEKPKEEPKAQEKPQDDIEALRQTVKELKEKVELLKKKDELDEAEKVKQAVAECRKKFKDFDLFGEDVLKIAHEVEKEGRVPLSLEEMYLVAKARRQRQGMLRRTDEIEKPGSGEGKRKKQNFSEALTSALEKVEIGE